MCGVYVRMMGWPEFREWYDQYRADSTIVASRAQRMRIAKIDIHRWYDQYRAGWPYCYSNGREGRRISDHYCIALDHYCIALHR